MAYRNALAALADPTRRRVFERLKSGPKPVGKIARGLPVSRPAVSQHLKVLKEAGLVTDRPEGTRRVYYIDPEGLGALRVWLDRFWDEALAFEVFTSGLDRWWPRKASIGSAPLKQNVLEPRRGGRWYQIGEDGSRADVGKILVWGPPHRFVMSWDINSSWKPDANVSSEVEVRFLPDGENATRVELEHRKFEQMGAEPGEKMRNDVDGGWPGLLELFKQAAEA